MKASSIIKRSSLFGLALLSVSIMLGGSSGSTASGSTGAGSTAPGASGSTSGNSSALPAQPTPNAAPCLTVSPVDPNKDFVGNFLNSCYAVQMSKGNGNHSTGDLNATYNQMYYQVQPGYSLLIFDKYPNARFLSATTYDAHVVIVGQMVDNQILPLNSTFMNPLLPGVKYVPNQQYGITVNLGGGSPVTVAAGCSTADTTVDQNVMDGSMIHTGDYIWTGYPNLPPNFPPHRSGPNTGGILEIRKYVDITNPPSTAVVIVRDLSTGCAIPAMQAISMNILAPTQPNPTPWLQENQMSFHQQFAESVLPKFCYPPDPTSQATFFRTRDYIPIDNGANASVHATVPAGYLPPLTAGKLFMRVQFQLPTHPTTPCTDGTCSLTGNEDQRYKSLSLQANNITLVSLKDTDFVTDPNGNVTLIVSLGAVPPAQVTAANYYTYVDLTTNPNYTGLNTLFVRDILPNPSFQCSSFNVPFKTMAFNPVGGYMGNYNMTVDFPTAAEIPTLPVPPNRQNTCATTIPPPDTPGDPYTVACPVPQGARAK